LEGILKLMIRTTKAIAFLFFSPARLVSHSVDEAIARRFRRGLFSSALAVFSALGLAIVTGWILHQFAVPMPPGMHSVLEYIGIGILLWATLARAENAIETIDGESLTERVDFWLYRILYIVGSYFLALLVAW
jgi:hypothetical protein